MNLYLQSILHTQGNQSAAQGYRYNTDILNNKIVPYLWKLDFFFKQSCFIVL